MNNTASVTPITATQPQAVAKFSITCTIDGFNVQVEVEGRADALRGMIDRLKAIGAQPPTSITSPTGETKSAPTCPVHNTPMAPSKHRAGTYYCKSSVGQAEDGRTLYCTKKA